MIKEVKYRGVTTTPSDYESPDGDLATSSNVVVDGDKLVVTKEPVQSYPDPASGLLDKKPLFIHNTTDNNTFYILIGSDNKLYYRHRRTSETETETDIEIEDAPQGEPKKIDAIGNTLIAMYGNGSIHYIIYKNGGYEYKGTHIPTVELQFGLNGQLKRKMTDNLEVEDAFDGAEQSPLTIKPGYEDVITNRVFGEVELALKEYGDNDDKFSAPFMVRYALRLYDGSYVNMSSPILMDNNFGKCPVVSFWAEGEDTKLKSFAVYNVYSTLFAKLVSGINALNGWEDIVKSIDIFVSKQFRNYDPFGKVGTIIPYYGNKFSDQGSSYSNSPLAFALSTNAWSGCLPGQSSGSGYSKSSYYNEYSNYFNDANLDGGRTRPRYQFDLPYYSDDELVGEQRGKIALNGSFYKLFSYKLTEIASSGGSYYGNELLTDGGDVPVESGVIANIETQTALPDDYYSNDSLKALASFVYNSRISFANIGRNPFCGFSAKALNAPVSRPGGDTRNHSAVVVYHVLIDENGKKTRVHVQNQVNVVQDAVNTYYGIVPTYFYYPNPFAKTLVVVVSIDGANPVTKKIDLLQHPTLNGAYYLSRDPINLSASDIVDMSSYEENGEIPYPSQIYTSETYNPYVFKAENVNQLPMSADIINIASTTQPMSQGQFGQFPLYVFSDAGIFALQLASNGSFSSLTPVTRDVILGDGSSLTQLDDSILFATKQGIMELVGKKTRCLTDKLDKKLSIPNLGNDIYAIIGTGTTPVVPDIKTFVNGCQMVYDYIHARVIVFNNSFSYVYVYSAKDDSWTLMPVSGLIDTINSFPDPLAVAEKEVSGTTKYALIDLSTITDEAGSGGTASSGWFITRPIDLDAPNDFKLIDVVRQNGVFEEYLINKTIKQVNNEDVIVETDDYKGYSGKIVQSQDPTIVVPSTDAHKVIEQILYGSNDLINWFVIGSSDSRLINGRTSAGFKWFRLAVKSTLKPGESISSVTFSYRIKAENPHLF